MWLASYSEAAFPLVEIRERLQRVGMSDLAQKPGRIRESSARGVFVGLYSFTVCTHASPHYHRRALQPPYFEPWKPLHHFYPPPPPLTLGRSVYRVLLQTSASYCLRKLRDPSTTFLITLLRDCRENPHIVKLTRVASWTGQNTPVANNPKKKKQVYWGVVP